MKYLITLAVLVVVTLKVIFGVINCVEHIEQQHKNIIEVSLVSNPTEGVF